MPNYGWCFLMCRFCLGIFLIFTCFCFNQGFSQKLDTGSLRDPFFPPPEFDQEKVERSFNAPEARVNLLGIIEVNDIPGAILERNGFQEVVFLGDKIWGCCVQKITSDFVLISREGKQVKLFFN